MRTPAARHQREQPLPDKGDIPYAKDVSERVDPGGKPDSKGRPIAAVINA
jgi:hypothetical protein